MQAVDGYLKTQVSPTNIGEIMGMYEILKNKQELKKYKEFLLSRVRAFLSYAICF